MAESLSVEVMPWSALRAIDDGSATLVVFAGEGLSLGAAAQTLLAVAAPRMRKAAQVANFKGRTQSALDLLAVDGLGFGRVLVMGVARKASEDQTPIDFAALGGTMAERTGGRVYVAFDFPEPPPDVAAAAAAFMLGVRLRAYKFDRYKTKKKDDEETGVGEPTHRIAIALENEAAAAARGAGVAALAQGVAIARNLVNEPPNVLFPVEFAARARQLESLGVEVETLDAATLERIGMRALLGVGQGSRHESRVVLLRWRGAGDESRRPAAFLGKGVCFDTGGISIKPAAGMEDMKGDMAGAACVVGLFHVLAARKARVNAVGAIGLVENMPGGGAQRPGDIVTSLSGQTIEIVNTDAEGRLVLADLLWHVNKTLRPQFMIDLATLTGAIVVALGKERAGLFANNDELAQRLEAAGNATGEGVWRMPLGAAYDKLLDSKFADVKNVGGRLAGSVTAAQFLQRFVQDCPWAHLDIAGVAINSPQTEINQSWGSGWGVRLLDRLVSDYYEA